MGVYVCKYVDMYVYVYMFMFLFIFVFICVYVYMCVPVCKSEKAMAPHSSTLAWKTPWTKEPCRLQSMGWLRVEHD